MRNTVGMIGLLWVGFACAGGTPGIEDPAPSPEPVPAPAPAPVPALGARALIDQTEAGCGFTFRGPDGAVWFKEEVGGGYLVANTDGQDTLLESAPARGKAKAGVDQGAYGNKAVHIELLRKDDTARVMVSIGDGTVAIKTKVKTNACM